MHGGRGFIAIVIFIFVCVTTSRAPDAHADEPAPPAADKVPPPPPGFGVGALTVLVGPEGGFSGAELSGIRAAGFRPVRFGAQVLRFETAALAAAACAAAARPGGAHG